MKKSLLRRFALRLALVALLVLPELADAQFFHYNGYGDVLAGFRKTGVNAGKYELLVNLGNITNFLKLPAGTTINITNLTTQALTDTYSNFNYLQWSVFSAVSFSGAWSTPLGSFPVYTLWYTLPGTNVNTQTAPPSRSSSDSQKPIKTLMNSVGNPGATHIANDLGATNADNNTVLVREPLTETGYTLSSYIGDAANYAIGDFGATSTPLPYDVENETPSSFTAAQRSDFYQVCPAGTVDPITSSTTASYFLGYFILNPNGTMTFTRASAVTVPSAGSVTSAVTNGFSPLTVVFTNSATSGSITNWVWNFGNGTVITNTTGTDVTNTYSGGGDYTVTLTVYGPGGSSTATLANYIVASPAPKLDAQTLSNGKLAISGTNGPAGVQYRILTSTNLALAVSNWIPVFTNTISSNGSYGYTNAMTTQTSAYYRLVSP